MCARRLLDRKRLLRGLICDDEPRVRYLGHFHECGTKFFAAACARDLEGVVAKWALGSYQVGPGTSWLKIKHATYSQMADRHELFESRRSAFEGRACHASPVLALR
jgi:ATP-dependent DNA ligase